MRVVVVGATGNIGTSLLRALAEDDRVGEIVGVARRRPQRTFPRTRWAAANVEHDDLLPIFRGADAVVHLAWRIQPSRDLPALWRTNVEGSTRVFQAVASAGVPALVYASSVGVYSPGPKDRRVDESWPAGGVPTSFYGRHKAEVERRLDAFEQEHPQIRVARLRPGLVFKREAASEIRRLFLGPLVPRLVGRRSLIRVVPDLARLRFQAVHSLDAGEAFRLALVEDARGAFNAAAEPPLDTRELAALLDARPVNVSARTALAFVSATWALRLHPTPPGWLDLARSPAHDTTRARKQLGWEPRWSSGEALLELMEGLRDGAGVPTPPLEPRAPVGVGGREP